MTYIAYYRVSTDRQGRSGLGLEAQRETVLKFLKGAAPLAEFTEVESGGKKSRPELLKAIAEAKRLGATLIVAKLDRLARSAHMILELRDAGVRVAFCDIPETGGVFGDFIVTVMAAFAEMERGLISERTKVALKAAKARGTKLGRAEENCKAANERAEALKPILVEMNGRPLSEIADMFNKRGIETPLGGRWHPTTVARVKRRLEA